MSGNEERMRYAPECPICRGITEYGKEHGVWIFRKMDAISIMCLNYDRNNARVYGEFNFFLPREWTYERRAGEVIRKTRRIECETCGYIASNSLVDILFNVLKNELRRYPEFRSISEI